MRRQNVAYPRARITLATMLLGPSLAHGLIQWHCRRMAGIQFRVFGIGTPKAFAFTEPPANTPPTPALPSSALGKSNLAGLRYTSAQFFCLLCQRDDGIQFRSNASGHPNADPIPRSKSSSLLWVWWSIWFALDSVQSSIINRITLTRLHESRLSRQP